MKAHRILSLILLVLAPSVSAASPAPAGRQPALPMEVPVLVIRYFPVQGDRIDRALTGDWGATLVETRAKTIQVTERVVAALQEGSRYHGYKNPNAKPSLAYRIVETIEYLEPLPTIAQIGRASCRERV